MRSPIVSLALLVVLTAGCGGAENDAAAVATPTVTISAPVAAIGSPVEMSYRFEVAPSATGLTDDYWVFVHFLDTSGELMWTDDHQPPTPVGQWKPGSTIEYQRTMFIPKFPYVGETQIEVGLFSRTTGDRLPMMGDNSGMRSYRVGTFEMALQTENYFVLFQNGWHGPELGDPGSGTEWQWSKKDATMTFANPKRDVRVYLSVDQPSTAFTEPQRVEVRIGPTVVDSFALPSGQDELRRFQVPAAQLGTTEMVEMTISVDKTFVPATIPSLASTDARELGIRVFRAFVQPM